MSDRNGLGLSPAMLRRRRKGLTATDAAPIFGLDPYRSALDVYVDKIEGTDVEMTQPMEWGLRLEGALERWWRDATGGTTIKPGLRRAPHVRSFPMLASLDRIAYVDDEVIDLELKTARDAEGYVPEADQLDVPPEKRIPRQHYIQVQHQLEVTELPRAEVAVLVRGADPRRYQIPRDRDFAADLVSEEDRFWHEHVLTRIPPAAGPDDAHHLTRRFPVATDEEKVATAELILVLDQLVELDRRLKLYGREREQLANQVREYIGTAKRVISGSAVATWARFDRTTTDWKSYSTSLEKLLRALAPLALEAASSPSVDLPDDTGRLEPVTRATFGVQLVPFVSDLDANLATLRGFYTKVEPSSQFTVRAKEE